MFSHRQRSLNSDVDIPKAPQPLVGASVSGSLWTRMTLAAVAMSAFRGSVLIQSGSDLFVALFYMSSAALLREIKHDLAGSFPSLREFTLLEADTLQQ